jgi:hypothetical protein
LNVTLSSIDGIESAYLAVAAQSDTRLGVLDDESVTGVLMLRHVV